MSNEQLYNKDTNLIIRPLCFNIFMNRKQPSHPHPLFYSSSAIHTLLSSSASHPHPLFCSSSDDMGVSSSSSVSSPSSLRVNLEGQGLMLSFELRISLQVIKSSFAVIYRINTQVKVGETWIKEDFATHLNVSALMTARILETTLLPR